MNVAPIRSRSGLLNGESTTYGHHNGMTEIGQDCLAGSVDVQIVGSENDDTSVEVEDSESDEEVDDADDKPEDELNAAVEFLPNGCYGPRLAENKSGTEDALDIFKRTAFQSFGALYEVGFQVITRHLRCR